MTRTKKLIMTLVLPLTIILFGTVTKWRYVYVEDGPDDFMYGFPMTFICSGWHTSMSLQIFVVEMIFDFFVYFSFCLTIITLIDRFIKLVTIKKSFKFGLYGLALLTIILYGLVFSNPDNIFEMKRDFKYKEIRNGYKFILQQDKR
ncbi:MAG: hypothetical protein QE277_08880 [Flectobacillus sp.]|nr:hypothetical protein [Flectobacillus sp.]